jgi:hypothetical protein
MKVRKLSLLAIAATAAVAVPAAAQDSQERRTTARKACVPVERCAEPRRVYPWFFHGQDEGAQVRRPVRKLALQR